MIRVLTASDWSEYALLDTGNQKRLEKFGPYTLVRPDPQAIWKSTLSENDWKTADAVFGKQANGREGWTTNKKLPDQWKLSYKDISFWVRLSPFKHTGVFPEQTAQWDWMSGLIKNSELRTKNDIKVLNLFAYTGIASLVCASAGAKVTHLDASKPTIGWARENQALSGLSNAPIRWILDDALKFVNRELKRGNRYDGIIMDPPVYGHGPEGEKWDFPIHFPQLLAACQQLLTPRPLFVLVNAYAISASSLMLENMMQQELGALGGATESGELILTEQSGRLLSTGIFSRWSSQ